MHSNVSPPPGDPMPPELRALRELPAAPQPRVHTAVDAVHEALDLLTTADLAALPTEDLRLLTGRLLRVGHRVDAATLRVIHDLDRRGVAVERGRTSTAAWLRDAHRLHPATATRLVRTAKALHDDPAGPLVPHPDDGVTRPRQGLRDAFAAGQLSAEHVTVITTAVDQLPDTVDPGTRADAETALVSAAGAHDPRALAHVGTHLRHTLDETGGEDLAETEARQVATRELQLREQNDGSLVVRGHLDPELGAAFRSQLTPLAAPRPTAADGHRDLRTAAQRNADALAEMLRRYAGAQLSPSSHGAAATVTVTMTLDTLQQRSGAAAASLDWSGPISAQTARRIACDARIIPVLLGSNGEPLDVGRSSYPVTQAIWRALVARDGGCAFAGCDRPPEWTQAHHRLPWENGGETSVENCCLFCDFHHRAVHHDGWDTVLANGAIHVIPPPWIDSTRTPRRNTQRAALAALADPTLLGLPEPDPPPRPART
jgi:Domain of unknown function (DUF222)